METIVNFDGASDDARLWTADRYQAERWVRLGYPVTAESGGWSSVVEQRLITFRSALKPKRKGRFVAKKTA